MGNLSICGFSPSPKKPLVYQQIQLNEYSPRADDVRGRKVNANAFYFSKRQGRMRFPISNVLVSRCGTSPFLLPSWWNFPAFMMVIGKVVVIPSFSDGGGESSRRILLCRVGDRHWSGPRQTGSYLISWALSNRHSHTQEHVLRLICSFSPYCILLIYQASLLVDPMMTLPIQSPLVIVSIRAGYSSAESSGWVRVWNWTFT